MEMAPPAPALNSAYESLPDLESYLNLTEQKLTDQFIKDIRRRASAKFFTKGDATSLAIREALSTKIREKFKEYFDNPSSAQSSDALRSWRAALNARPQ